MHVMLDLETTKVSSRAADRLKPCGTGTPLEGRGDGREPGSIPGWENGSYRVRIPDSAQAPTHR